MAARRSARRLRGEASGRPVRDRLRARPADLVDVFVYVVVLNLAVEYVPAVISEGVHALALAPWVVAAGSKFVVLVVIDLVFGDAVSLGGFFSVTLLIVCLLIARAGVRSLLDEGPTPPR